MAVLSDVMKTAVFSRGGNVSCLILGETSQNDSCLLSLLPGGSQSYSVLSGRQINYHIV